MASLCVGNLCGRAKGRGCSVSRPCSFLDSFWRRYLSIYIVCSFIVLTSKLKYSLIYFLKEQFSALFFYSRMRFVIVLLSYELLSTPSVLLSLSDIGTLLKQFRKATAWFSHLRVWTEGAILLSEFGKLLKLNLEFAFDFLFALYSVLNF